jgi:hypothetical protein
VVCVCVCVCVCVSVCVCVHLHVYLAAACLNHSLSVCLFSMLLRFLQSYLTSKHHLALTSALQTTTGRRDACRGHDCDLEIEEMFAFILMFMCLCCIALVGSGASLNC